MLAARNLRPQQLSRRLTAPSRCCSSANRVIAPSPPEPAQEEKGWSTLMQEYWVLIPAALFGSAAWNIFRHIAKENVRNRRESKLKMEGIEGNQIHNVCSTESLDSLEFRKVACKGVYDENNSILVHKYLKTKSGEWINGYNLLTPLIPIPDEPQSIQLPILVNRGWVPLSWGNKPLGVESNSSSSAPTPVEFVGVISKGEKPNRLWRSNKPAKSEWFTADITSIARACGLPETTLHVVEIDMSRNMNTRKPPPFAFLRREVKGIYLSQLEHDRYACLGFFKGCATIALGIKKFGNR